MNKDSTGSINSPRSSRTKKKKPVNMRIMAAVGLLLLIVGAIYTINETQTGPGQKQTSQGKDPAGQETADQNDDMLTDVTGDEQADDSGVSEQTPIPDEGAAGNEEPAEVLPEAPAEEETDPIGGQEASAEPNEGSGGNTASENTSQTVKLPTTYVVRKGDTLSTISMKFYQSKKHVALLAEQNDIVFINDLNVGDTIKIPALTSKAETAPDQRQDDQYNDKITLPATYMVRAGDTLYHIAMQFYQSADYVDLIAEHNKLAKDEDLKAGTHLNIPAIPKNQAGNKNDKDNTAATNHTVRKGETLSSISRKYYGSNKYAKTIADYNQLADDNDVKVGDVLKIPPVPTP